MGPKERVAASPHVWARAGRARSRNTKPGLGPEGSEGTGCGFAARLGAGQAFTKPTESSRFYRPSRSLAACGPRAARVRAAKPQSTLRTQQKQDQTTKNNNVHARSHRRAANLPLTTERMM